LVELDKGAALIRFGPRFIVSMLIFFVLCCLGALRVRAFI